MHQPPIPHVARTDPEIADLVEHEARREFEKIRLIPSENYVSLAVLEASGPVRRRAAQRPAVLGLAREPGRLSGLRPARRHDHGHVAADGRPPDPRLAGVGLPPGGPPRPVPGAPP